jgi:hypothetical protein
MTACGGGSSNSGGNGGGGVNISISPNSTVSVGVTLAQQFTASVSGTSNTAVNWTVAGSGCSAAACGTVNSSGLYTAPPAVPNPATVTVTATSAADSTKSASVNVKIIDISVTVSPTTATVALNGTQQFNAVASPSNAPQTVNWTVAAGGNGTTCTGAACGTINSSGLYTAPSSLPPGNPVTITVTATSTIDSVGTKNATITLVSSLNNRLKGTYAFHFSGSDLVGAVISAGNVVANGSGAITSGLLDMTNTSGPQSLVINGGSYVVGSDGRGYMALATTSSNTFCYSFALGANGETAFVEFDQITSNSATVCTAAGLGLGVRGSGILDVVPNPASLFKNSALTGPFVFGFYGEDLNAKKVGYAGVLTGDGAGNLTSGQADINDGGVAQNVPSFTGTYSVSATGRGTMTLNPPSATPLNFAFYIVGPSEIFFVSTDPVVTNPRVGGLAIGQDITKTFDDSVFNGASIFNLTGVDSTGSFSNVAAGLANTDGAGNVSGVFDQNNAGAVSPNSSFSGTYTAAAGGRYTIQLLGQPFVLYAVTTNKGFLLDQSSSSVLNGFIEPQTNSPFSNSSIQGTFAAITSSVANTTAEDIVAALSLASSGSVTGTQDQTDSNGENPNQAITGSYSVSSNGRGTMNFSAPAVRNRAIYVVSNSKFVAVGMDSGDKSATVITAER